MREVSKSLSEGAVLKTVSPGPASGAGLDCRIGEWPNLDFDEYAGQKVYLAVTGPSSLGRWRSTGVRRRARAGRGLFGDQAGCRFVSCSACCSWWSDAGVFMQGETLFGTWVLLAVRMWDGPDNRLSGASPPRCTTAKGAQWGWPGLC